MKLPGPSASVLVSAFLLLCATSWASPLVIKGTDGDDTVVVTATGVDSGSYRVNDGPDIRFYDLKCLTFNGGNGNDTLRVVNPSRGLFAPKGGIFCNGEAQSGPPGDKLEMIGGSSSEASSTMGPTADAGMIRHAQNGIVQTIRFTGLEPVNDTVGAVNFTFTAPSGATTINVVDGPVVDGFQTTQINDGGTGAFEQINFANKTNVTVNGGTGVNNISVNIPTPAVGLNSLTVDTGGQAAETISVGTVNVSAGVTLMNSGGAVTVNSGPGIVASGGVRITAGTAVTFNGSVSAPSSFVGINGGAAITQASGATLTTNSLLVVGTGPATLTDTGNSANSFAANVTNGISYTNTGKLTVLSISILSFGSSAGGRDHQRSN